MNIDDSIFESATEGEILKFTFSLYELAHHGCDSLKAAAAALGCDRGALIQHKEGRGSIGPEGWERLGAEGFDLRAYDIWMSFKRKTYRIKR